MTALDQHVAPQGLRTDVAAPAFDGIELPVGYEQRIASLPHEVVVRALQQAVKTKLYLEQQIADATRTIAERDHERDAMAKQLDAKNHDSRTGVLTHDAGIEAIRERYPEGVPEGKVLIIATFDLRGLHMINQAASYDAGSVLIAEAAKRLRELVRKDEILARWGGDEFFAVIETDPENVDDIVKRFEALEGTYNESNGEPLWVDLGEAGTFEASFRFGFVLCTAESGRDIVEDCVESAMQDMRDRADAENTRNNLPQQA